MKFCLALASFFLSASSYLVMAEEPESPAVCPPGSIPDATNEACCPEYCNKCGDNGCHLRPGGEFECCPSTFKYSCHDDVAPCILVDKKPKGEHDPTVCPENSIMDPLGNYCCPEYCGQCGGDGCHLYPGGEFQCCWSTFKYSCFDGVAPCILDKPEEPEPEEEEKICPPGSIPDVFGRNCCPEFCGHCGDMGCHLLPGGEYNCCPSTFKYTCHDGIAPCHLPDPEKTNDVVHDATVCPENSIRDRANENCCPAYCTTCGGEGCHLLPGGEYECCPSKFVYSCFDGVAPCILEKPEV